MSEKVVQKMRQCAAIVSGGAIVVLGGVAVYGMQGVQVVTAKSSSGATAITTTPPTAPAIAKAVPSITGPAPLYAGEGPDSNPQAPIP